MQGGCHKVDVVETVDTRKKVRLTSSIIISMDFGSEPFISKRRDWPSANELFILLR